LQERYGYSREEAANEIDRRVTDFEARLKEDLKDDVEMASKSR
jgi:hypothetical protein